MNGPVDKRREFVCVSRRPGAAAVSGQPTTREVAFGEAAAKLVRWPDARVAVYRLVLIEGKEQ